MWIKKYGLCILKMMNFVLNMKNSAFKLSSVCDTGGDGIEFSEFLRALREIELPPLRIAQVMVTLCFSCLLTNAETMGILPLMTIFN